MSDGTRQGSRKGRAPTRWLHPSQSLIKGSIIYTVKFWGYCPVPQASGADVVRTAIEKLKLQHQLRKQQGIRSLKVALAVSYRGLRVQDAKTKAILHQHSLNKISYAGDDKSDKSLFAYIAAEGKEPNKIFKCYIFDTDKFAMQVSLTVAQAFHLAFKVFEEQAGGRAKPGLHNKLPSMQRQSIDEAEAPIAPVAQVPEDPAPQPVAAAATAQKPSEPAAAQKPSEPAAAQKPSEPAEQKTSTLDTATAASAAPASGGDNAGYFEPFDFNAENEMPAPVFGPGIEDIEGAIKHIEEQLATLAEGFEQGFTISNK